MDLADHLRTIASNWWRILVIAFVIGAAVFSWSNQQPNTYSAAVLINVVPEVDRAVPIDSNTIAIRVQNVGFTLKNLGIAQAAVTNGKLDKEFGLDARELQSRMSSILVPLAGNIVVKSEANSTNQALKQSEALAKALFDNSVSSADAEQQRKIQAAKDAIVFLNRSLTNPSILGTPTEKVVRDQIDAQNSALALLESSLGQNLGVVRIVGFPTVENDGEPVAPHPTRDGLLAFLVAFIVAAEGFVVRRALSDRVSKATSVEAITELTGLPVLAQVPRGRGPEVVEAFRTLRTNLMFLEGSGRPRTIAILSPNPAAGKSFCAIHLAESAVAVDAQVVLIDADLRRPVLHQRLRTPREPGLSDALRGAALETTLHRVEGHANLHLMPSGAPVADTVAALGGRAFRTMLETLDGAELIIVDTPPGAGYADALAVAAQCDAALLVLDAETTRRRTTKQFIEALDRTGASLIGVVLNGATVNKRDTYER